jgi:hypothetical protein
MHLDSRPMVYAPGHLQQVERVNAPGNQRQRRRLLVSICTLLLVCAVGFTAWSLTRSAPRNGGGCIAFGFMTATGGSSQAACGTTARDLCLATVPTLVADGDYYAEMHRACRSAGLPTSPDRASPSS